MDVIGLPISKRHSSFLCSLQKKKKRNEHNRFLVEGVRLCQEAVLASATITEVLLCPALLSDAVCREWIEYCKRTDIPLYTADERQFRLFADTETPQGIACVVEKPKAGAPRQWLTRPAFLLALDGIGDPGNLGTIIRSADWFGVEAVFLSRGCVDAFNTKAVRSTMGGIFRVPVVQNISWEELLPAARENSFRVIASVLERGVPLQKIMASDRDLIMVGGEAVGLSPEIEPFFDLRVTIPRVGGGESLNAAMAASILLYHFRNC